MLNPSEYPVVEALVAKNNETPAFYVDKKEQSREKPARLKRVPSAEANYFN